MRVLAVSGASGGHIFPAVSFLRALKEAGPSFVQLAPSTVEGGAGKDKEIEALLALPKNSIAAQLEPGDYRVKYLSIRSIGLGFSFRNLLALWGFLKGCGESLFLLLGFKPDAVVGFGGLNSVPLLLLAWLFRIKTFIHEQNVIPGRANRLLARFSDKVAVSFNETKNYLKIRPKRIIVTGNPLRRELKIIEKAQALNFFGFKEGKFTVLVMGGSLGSQKINACFLEAASLIADKSSFQFIHIAGAKDYPALENSYKGSGIQVKLLSFLKEMQYAYSASDLALCRAGATTIAELAFFALPAVIIPYPFAYQHQARNAAVLENRGAAVVISDDQLGGQLLMQALVSFLANPARLRAMRAGYSGFLKSNAGDLLARQVLDA